MVILNALLKRNSKFKNILFRLNNLEKIVLKIESKQNRKKEKLLPQEAKEVESFIDSFIEDSSCH